MNKEALKTAAVTLRALNEERNKLAAEKEQVKLAREIVSQLTKQSELSSKDVLEKLAEFESKTSEELTLIKTAMTYAGTKEFMKLGHLSEDQPMNNGSIDNLTAFLIGAE